MAQNKNNINLTEILLQCMGKADPMLEMLKWLCNQFTEAELSDRIGADKNAAISVPAIAAVTGPDVSIRAWEPCIC